MAYYERNLPHWHPEGKSVFITWRLYGSLPAGFLRELKGESQSTAGRKFRKADKELDRAEHGPLWLKDERIAGLVVDTIKRGADPLGQYRLHAFVVMANHVHVLIDPLLPLKRIMDGLKGVSAREANKILGRTGKPFWQDESFDRWVRNGAEFERIRAYIEWNPVAAGLVPRPEDWPWTSAAQHSHSWLCMVFSGAGLTFVRGITNGKPRDHLEPLVRVRRPRHHLFPTRTLLRWHGN